MAKPQNELDTPKMDPEEWEELSAQLWKDFRYATGWTGDEGERQARAQAAIAIAAIQPFKPK